MWKRLIKDPLVKAPSQAQVARHSPWHAVSIVSRSGCCEAATGMTGTRFLSKEAPRLPLGNCSMSARCCCSYQHHDDRRCASRRTEDPWSPGRADGYSPEKRGRKRGRRAADGG